MIPKSAVRAFLNRPRDDLRKYKKLSAAELERHMEALPVKPPIWYKLLKHQQVGLIVGAIHKRVALFFDTGTGKTLLAIALARYFKKAGEVKHFLVLVPNKINLSEWILQIERHSPKTRYLVLRGSSKDKWRLLEESHTPLITLCTYAGLIRMVCELTRKPRSKKMRLKPTKNLVRNLTELFDGYVFDESTLAQSKHSLFFRICRHFSKNARALFPLSGTPFGRDPTPLWAQMYLVDHGESLGETLGLFRAAFFTTKVNHWGGYEHTFIKKNKTLVHDLIAHRSLRYEADASDLPQVVRVSKEVTLTADARDYMNEAWKAIKRAGGNPREIRNIFLRTRQISSGFLGYMDDDTGRVAQFVFPSNPKLDMTMSVVESVVGEHKMVLFHDFIFSGRLIYEALEDRKIGFARIKGGMTDAQQDTERRRFDQDDSCRVIVINSAFAMGPNLQRAKYLGFFESPIRPITRTQAERRVERQYSEHKKIFIYDFITRGTFDQTILNHLAEGKDLFRAIVDGKFHGKP